MRTSVRKPCPHLPPAREGMSWRGLRGRADAGRLYEEALRYAQHLWLAGLTGRSILALDRALLSPVEAGAEVLGEWPLPYPALAWLLREHPPGAAFPGNPRVHYQHLADRVRGEEAPRKRARAWAGWHLACAARPELPGDQAHRPAFPEVAATRAELQRHGHPGEAGAWEKVLMTCRTAGRGELSRIGEKHG